MYSKSLFQKMCKTVKIYTDGTNQAPVLGYKGESLTTGPFFYMPYMPLFVTSPLTVESLGGMIRQELTPEGGVPEDEEI